MRQLNRRRFALRSAAMAVGLAVALAGCSSGFGPTDLGSGDGPPPRRASAPQARTYDKPPSPTRDLLRAER